MALKLKLESLDGLDDTMKALYKKLGDDDYQLDLEGYQDPGALLRAKQHEKDQRQEAERQLREVREQLSTLQEEFDEEKRKRAGKNGKTEELEAAWQEKFNKKVEELKAEIDKREARIRTLLVDHVADAMAAELSDAPELLGDLIRKRLTVMDGETRVLDNDGKLSALTVDELKTEFKSNKKYAAVIRGSQAAGGGSAGGGNGSGAPGDKSFKDMTEAERTALAKSNPVEYQKQFDAFKAQARATA